MPKKTLYVQMTDGTLAKFCSICGETKPLDQFGVRRRSKDGHAGQCRLCERTRLALANKDRPVVSVVCSQCGQSYEKRIDALALWRGRCARCAKRPGRLYTPDDFWALVDRTGEGCWPWTGQRAYGYGALGYQKRAWRAHRLAYVLTYGTIAPGAIVRHLCNNRLCCRPDHLAVGTQAENIADRERAGTTARGSRHGKHTHPESRPRGDNHWTRRRPPPVSDDDVRSAIDERKRTGASYEILAARFGVCPSTLWKYVQKALDTPPLARGRVGD